MDALQFIRNLGLLRCPGDEMNARVTKSGRQVLRISKNNGTEKYSAVRYSNGTVVETKTTKQK